MQELILSIVLMYAAVGSAAFWYRRQLAANTDLTGNHIRNEGTD